ncbi:MAG: mechanosensitive ion channel [Gammaproteobacteria bacterium]
MTDIYMPYGRLFRAARSGFLALFVALGGLYPVPAPAASAQQALNEWINSTATQIKEIERELRRATTRGIDQDRLSALLKQTNQIKSRAQSCVDTQQEQADSLSQDLETLGQPAKEQSAEVRRIRQRLLAQQQTVAGNLASCKLFLVGAQDLINQITQQQQALVTQQLLTRTPNLIHAMQEGLKTPGSWFETAHSFLDAQYKLLAGHLTTVSLTILGFLLLVFIPLGLVLRHLLQPKAPPVLAQEDRTVAFTVALRCSLLRRLPAMFAAVIIAVGLSVILPLRPTLPFPTDAAYAAVVYLFALTIVDLLLAPPPPATPYFPGPDKLWRRFSRRLKIFVTLCLILYLLFSTTLKDSLTDNQYFLLRAGIGTLLIANLISTTWLVRHFPWAILGRGARVILIGAFLLTLGAEYAGFRNLSAYVLGGLLGTLTALMLAILVTRLFTDLYDGMDEGRLLWQQRLRVWLGVHMQQNIPGLIWLRAATFIAIWVLFALWFMFVWNLSDPGFSLISTYLKQGFTVGTLQVVPVQLLWAVIAFAIISAATRLIKSRLLPEWLHRTRLDRGAREAVTTITGYIGIALAALIALSLAGFGLGKLALIAGALSVGIGFGLQNIVNNFVSGLILLFERPIRTGDWIVTGETEGHVKRISIRSTQIQTFDRADVIVPNSELISAKVTNWMLYDRQGRVRVPVGVAYGSDTQKVKEVLLEVAHNHPDVIKGSPLVPEPRVLFLNFGDSSLNFELRCFVREIDDRLSVLSDLNFAVDAAFRREGIEIPFPQRDIHVRNWPPGSPPPPAPDDAG